MRFLAITTLIGIFVGYAGPARALSEFVPIQERAQGQSLTGSHLLNDSIYSNPASSAFTHVYSVEGTFLLPKTFGISIMDTKTSELGGGVGYFRQQDPDTGAVRQGLKLTTLGRASGNVGLGLAGKTIWGPTPGKESDRMWDMDSGVLVNLNPLQLGLTFRNILGGNPGFELDRELAFGARINYNDTVFLSASLLSTWGVWKPYQFGFGAEYVSPYYFSLKGGYRILSNVGDSFWSLGASVLSPNLSLHYAVEFPNQGGRGAEHIFAASLLF